MEFINNNITPLTRKQLMTAYGDFLNPGMKIERETKAGNLVRLMRGLYLPASDGAYNIYAIANRLLVPSYVSCLTALWWWGIIPEYPKRIQSMTTHRSIIRKNVLRTFSYIHCKDDYFALGIRNETDGGVQFQIASPEKALCDIVVTTTGLNLRYRREIELWMDEDMRFDFDELAKMNTDLIRQCSVVGKKHIMLLKMADLIDSLK